jgi:hypothetical protein
LFTVTHAEARPLELVVADDGSIPATQLSSLGLGAGAHLRVVESTSSGPADDLEGSLADFPDITWEDFELASDLTTEDASSR